MDCIIADMVITVAMQHKFIYTLPMNTLRQIIDDLDVSQVQFAKAMGYSEQYISNLVTGRQHLTAAFIGRVTLVYGLDIAVRLLPYADQVLPANARIVE